MRPPPLCLAEIAGFGWEVPSSLSGAVPWVAQHCIIAHNQLGERAETENMNSPTKEWHDECTEHAITLVSEVLRELRSSSPHSAALHFLARCFELVMVGIGRLSTSKRAKSLKLHHRNRSISQRNSRSIFPSSRTLHLARISRILSGRLEDTIATA